MTSTAEPLVEVSKLSKEQKLAALLLILAPDNSVQIMKSLDQDMLEAVTGEMAKLPVITQEMQGEILREFSSVAVEAGSSIVGGIDRVQNLLEKSVGLFRASDVLCRVAPSRPPVPAMQQIIEMDPRRIVNLLREEQPQTVAMLASYLPPERASQVLGLMRPELRDQVIERMATLAPTSAEVVEDIVEVLHRNSGNSRGRPLTQTGGTKAAAKVLNALPKNVSKTILLTLTERNAELGEAIRQTMFTFEDLQHLDVRTVQRIMQSVDTRTLTVALKTASDKLKNALLSSISRRAAENVKEEMEMMESVKIRDIEQAQNEIVNVARQLESDGEIELDAIAGAKG